MGIPLPSFYLAFHCILQFPALKCKREKKSAPVLASVLLSEQLQGWLDGLITEYPPRFCVLWSVVLKTKCPALGRSSVISTWVNSAGLMEKLGCLLKQCFSDCPSKPSSSLINYSVGSKGPQQGGFKE